MYAQKHHLRSEFFTFIQLGEVTTTEMVISTGFLKGFSLEVRDDVALDFKQELPSLYPVHKCITSFSDDAMRKEDNLDQLRDLADKRLNIAKQLLAMTDPVIDLHLYDEQGLSILHKSIFLRDNNFTAYIIELLTQPNPERKTSLNINSRCHKKGWAPLHYAIEASNLDGMTMLCRAGANLTATSATDKKLTPLELAKQKLKNSPQNAQREQFQQVIDHLQRLIADQKGGSGKKGESAATQTHGRQESKAVSLEDSSVSAALKVAEKKSNAKKKQDTKKKGAAQPASKESNTNAAADKKDTASSSGSGAQTTIKQSAPSVNASNSVNFLAGMSVASRDELVDRLLAMGFAETDCLQAISRYGTDIDQAISWLCERPPSGASQVESVIKEVSAPAPVNRVAKTTTKIESKGGSQAASATASASDALKSDPEAALRLQKEREELRRINRAWNARAEDEKRKVRLLIFCPLLLDTIYVL
ncbi:hypothetical protein EON65_01090 [archaeon]|nr:MAG: hypothetical protein EON65_01090 [archaeon]